MQSQIKVKITPRKMDEIYEVKHEKYKVTYYEFLGVNEIGDFDAGHCSEKEWLSIADTPCIYKAVLEHEDFWYLMRREMYLSWSGVERALKMKKKNT